MVVIFQLLVESFKLNVVLMTLVTYISIMLMVKNMSNILRKRKEIKTAEVVFTLFTHRGSQK